MIKIARYVMFLFGLGLVWITATLAMSQSKIPKEAHAILIQDQTRRVYLLDTQTHHKHYLGQVDGNGTYVVSSNQQWLVGNINERLHLITGEHHTNTDILFEFTPTSISPDKEWAVTWIYGRNIFVLVNLNTHFVKYLDKLDFSQYDFSLANFNQLYDYGEQFIWSADSKWIYFFLRGENQMDHVLKISPHDETVEEIAQVRWVADFSKDIVDSFRFSPDGRWITYVELGLANLDTQTGILYHVRGTEESLSRDYVWTSGNKLLLHEFNPILNIYSLNEVYRDLPLTIDLSTSPHLLTLAPDGSRDARVEKNLQQITIFDIETRTYHAIKIPAENLCTQLVWSSDAEWLLYGISDETLHKCFIYKVRYDGSSRKNIYNVDLLELDHPYSGYAEITSNSNWFLFHQTYYEKILISLNEDKPIPLNGDTFVAWWVSPFKQPAYTQLMLVSFGLILTSIALGMLVKFR